MGKHKIEVDVEDGNSLSEDQIDWRVKECDCVIILHTDKTEDIVEGIKGVIATGFIVAYAHRYPESTALLIKNPKPR